MRLALSNAAHRVSGSRPGQILLARALAVRAEGGMKAALWPTLHALGASLFLIAMIALLAQAETTPLSALAPGATGPATFPNQERLAPSAPNSN